MDPILKPDIKNDFQDSIEWVPLDKAIYTDVSDFRDFNFDTDVPENFCILISSRRGSGKTNLIQWFSYNIRNRFKHAYLVSPTAHIQVTDIGEPVYNFIPEVNRMKYWDEDIMKGLIDKQKKLKEEWCSLPKSERKGKEHPILIILDDILSDPNVISSPLIKEMTVNGRQFWMNFVISVQTVSARAGFPSYVRQNTDLFISFTVFDEFNRQTIVEQYLSTISKKSGLAILNSITALEEYMAIAINTRLKDVKLYKNFVFKIKAPPPEKLKYGFTIGLPDREMKKSSVEYIKGGLNFELSGYKQAEIGLRFSSGPKQGLRIETPISGKPIQKKITQLGAKKRYKLTKRKKNVS